MNFNTISHFIQLNQHVTDEWTDRQSIQHAKHQGRKMADENNGKSASALANTLQ